MQRVTIIFTHSCTKEPNLTLENILVHLFRFCTVMVLHYCNGNYDMIFAVYFLIFVLFYEQRAVVFLIHTIWSKIYVARVVLDVMQFFSEWDALKTLFPKLWELLIVKNLLKHFYFIFFTKMFCCHCGFLYIHNVLMSSYLQWNLLSYYI